MIFTKFLHKSFFLFICCSVSVQILRYICHIIVNKSRMIHLLRLPHLNLPLSARKQPVSSVWFRLIVETLPLWPEQPVGSSHPSLSAASKPVQLRQMTHALTKKQSEPESERGDSRPAEREKPSGVPMSPGCNTNCLFCVFIQLRQE